MRQRRARHRANELLLTYQLDLLAQGHGELYPNVEETLKELDHRGYQLFVASNGLESYVKGVVESKLLTPYFDAVYSAGEFATPSKVGLVGLLINRYQLTSAWMCGDRSSDVEAGHGNRLFTVGCNYGGFHYQEELQNADLTIHSFRDLLLHLH